MIKIALKHYIYEFCISQMFKGISNNFRHDMDEFSIGSRYQFISQDNNWNNKKAKGSCITHYYDVTITGTAIREPINNVHKGGWNIYFDYDSATCCQFDKNGNLLQRDPVTNVVGIGIESIIYFERK